eukprot:gene2137-2456_t
MKRATGPLPAVTHASYVLLLGAAVFCRINNCVGLRNMRLFLVFLLANCFTCFYGVLLAAAALTGELKRRGFLDVYIYDPELRERVPIYARPSKLLEWVIVYYPVPVAVAVFMAITGLLMVAFFMYHGMLISQGRTTYETFKRDQMYKDIRAAALAAHAQTQQINQADGAEEPVIPGTQHVGAGAAARAVTSIGGFKLRRRQLQAAAVQLPPNLYNKGLLHNWLEVLFPEQFLLWHGDNAQMVNCDNVISAGCHAEPVLNSRAPVRPEHDVSSKKMR